MPKRTLLFAPCAFNLAETSRMVEIAKAVARHPTASQVFDIHFISDGGDFEPMIEKHGFALTRLEPRLTKEKIELIAKVDRGEKFTPAFTDAELIAARRQRSRLSLEASTRCRCHRFLRHHPGYVPRSAGPSRLGRAIHLASGFLLPRRGHDGQHPPSPVKAVADWLVCVSSTSGSGTGFSIPSIVPPNTSGFLVFVRSSTFGAATLRWSPNRPNFPGSTLPPEHFFIGPLIPQDEFPMPPELLRNPEGQTTDLFRDGKFRDTGYRRENHREFRGQALSGDRSRSISAFAHARRSHSHERCRH